MYKHNYPKDIMVKSKANKTKASITLLRDLCLKNRNIWLPVLSGSMQPLFGIGDEVQVQSINPNNIRTGDIIVFADHEKLIVHRVIKKLKKERVFFLQKGDNAIETGVVQSKDIIGRVTCVRKRMRMIHLDHGAWKILGLILTCLSCSSYYLEPRSQVFLKITRLIARFNNKILKI